MPDRRQGDRREGGSKKLTISLSTFVFIVLIAIIFFVSIIVCIIVGKKSYNDGYYKALSEASTIMSEEVLDNSKDVSELEAEAAEASRESNEKTETMTVTE